MNIPFLKYKKLFRVSFSWNIKNFWWVFIFWNIRTAFFWESIRSFFQGFCFLKYKKSFLLRNFLGVDFFHFLSLGWKVQGSISGNTRKAFFWENIRNFLILELECSISWNIRSFFRGEFFLSLGLKVTQTAPQYTTSLNLNFARNETFDCSKNIKFSTMVCWNIFNFSSHLLF